VIPAGNIIGVDESGKGDFFGPLVVAALLAGDADRAFLTEIGVRDSKRLSDRRIAAIGEQLRSRFPHSLLVLMPEEYNRRYEQIKNLNVLLADCHARVIAAALEQGVTQGIRVDLAISDKFGKTERLLSALARIKCLLPVEQLVRGEAILQVAAASILARAEFVRRMQQLSEDIGIELPKGASAEVDAVGRQVVAQHGETALRRVSKKHFKNYHRSLSVDLFR